MEPAVSMSQTQKHMHIHLHGDSKRSNTHTQKKAYKKSELTCNSRGENKVSGVL